MNQREQYNDDFVKTLKFKLEKMDWEPMCAEKFACFLEKTNENNANCYPDKYPYWCEFVIAAHRLPQRQRPSEDNIAYVLQEFVGWDPDGEPVKGLIDEYLKELWLLNMYDEKKDKI